MRNKFLMRNSWSTDYYELTIPPAFYHLKAVSFGFANGNFSKKDIELKFSYTSDKVISSFTITSDDERIFMTFTGNGGRPEYYRYVYYPISDLVYETSPEHRKLVGACLVETKAMFEQVLKEHRLTVKGRPET